MAGKNTVTSLEKNCFCSLSLPMSLSPSPLFSLFSWGRGQLCCYEVISQGTVKEWGCCAPLSGVSL